MDEFHIHQNNYWNWMRCRFEIHFNLFIQKNKKKINEFEIHLIRFINPNTTLCYDIIEFYYKNPYLITSNTTKLQNLYFIHSCPQIDPWLNILYSYKYSLFPGMWKLSVKPKKQIKIEISVRSIGMKFEKYRSTRLHRIGFGFF